MVWRSALPTDRDWGAELPLVFARAEMLAAGRRLSCRRSSTRLHPAGLSVRKLLRTSDLPMDAKHVSESELSFDRQGGSVNDGTKREAACYLRYHGDRSLRSTTTASPR